MIDCVDSIVVEDRLYTHLTMNEKLKGLISFLKSFAGFIVSTVLLYLFPVIDMVTGEVLWMSLLLILAIWITIYGLIDEILTSRYDRKELKEYYFWLLKSKTDYLAEMNNFNELWDTDSLNRLNNKVDSIEVKIDTTFELLNKINLPVLTYEERIVSNYPA